MVSATVVIPTTGSDTLDKAISSVKSQTYQDIKCLVVIDGPDFTERAMKIIDRYSDVMVLQLPENTGANGFYGHRIYAASSYLINTDYVLYLDQDNWFTPDHVLTQLQNCVNNKLDWGYSLRGIYDKDGNFLLDDNCESLGKWPIFLSDTHFLVDTSCYCIKRDVIVRVGGAWYGGWGGDRMFYSVINHHFPNYATTGLHTLCYRVDGNAGSVNKDFFVQGNSVMQSRYPDGYPWHGN